jgi:Recombination endonuclease VII
VLELLKERRGGAEGERAAMRGIVSGPRAQGVFLRRPDENGRMRPFRICSRCHETKPLSNFPIMKNGSNPRHYAYCYPCHRDYQKARGMSVKALREKGDPAFYRKIREKRWRAQGMRSSLDPEAPFTQNEFDVLMKKQNGRCAGCGREFGPNLRPCVDHKHEHGKIGRVRGILCWNDNRRLADSSQLVLSNLLEYLIRTEGREIP